MKKIIVLFLVFLLSSFFVSAATIYQRYTLDFGNTNGILNLNNINGIYQVKYGDYADLLSKASMCGTSSCELVLIGEYTANQTLVFNGNYARIRFINGSTITAGSGFS